MKKILLLVTLIAASLTTFAQDDNTATKLSVGFTAGAGTGAISNEYPVSGGLAIKAEYPLSGTPVALVFTTGLTFFVSANGYSTDYDVYGDGGDYSSGSLATFVPVQLGAKIYVTHRLFVQGDVGASFFLGSSDGSFEPPKVGLLVSPSAGYTISFGSTRASLDVGVGFDDRFESGGSLGSVALRVQFNFGLGSNQ
jgi:hypothetical protein